MTTWTPQQTQPVQGQQPWTLPARHSPLFYLLTTILLAAGVGSFVAVIPLLSEAEGGGKATIAAILALIPVVVVTGILFWVDSWEPEPRWLMAGMFAWGGGPAVLIALWLNTDWAEHVARSTANSYKGELWGVVISAPIVEEAAKGIGVLIAFLVFYRYFNGPIDGICYGAMSGLGFAFTENILYFTRFWDSLGETYTARALTSPLLHPISTAMMGLMLGFAVYAKSRWIAIPYFLLGYLAGVLIHGMHNGSASIDEFSFLVWGFQVPSYLAALVLVLWLRHDEVNIIRARLTEYQRAGWFAPYEVEMLTSPSGRRRAKAWASSRGQRTAMKRFQQESTHLALNRQRAAQGNVSIGRAQAIEARSLQAVGASRAQFLGAR